jgi:hypothetical protein
MEKHNRMRNLLLFLFLPIVFTGISSCMPDPLEVETVPRIRPQLVVSTQIIPDESLLVLLTRTFGALDAHDKTDVEKLAELIAVNDAMVVIKGPKTADTLNFLGNGMYGGIAIPFRAGESYSLYADSPELGSLSAITQVMEKVDFTNVQAELYYNGFNDTLAQITYTFKDLPGDNWYMLNVQEVEREDLIENFLNPRAFTLLLSDEQFSGKSYGERFRVFPRDYHPGDTIAVSLSNISEQYYRFTKLRMDNRFGFVEFISEPVNYPSNVIGGKGYFNLYLPDVRFFVFE